MGDLDATLGHHLDQVPVRKPIGDVPAHAQLNDVCVECPFAVDRVTGDRLRHSAPRAIRFGSLPDAPRCTRAQCLGYVRFRILRRIPTRGPRRVMNWRGTWVGIRLSAIEEDYSP